MGFCAIHSIKWPFGANSSGKIKEIPRVADIIYRAVVKHRRLSSQRMGRRRLPQQQKLYGRKGKRNENRKRRRINGKVQLWEWPFGE